MLIKNGCVIDPANGIAKKADVLIENGKIARVEENIEYSGETVDATGCVVAPGFVDVHVHFRDPGFEYKEDIESGAKAALAGGFTSVVLMANTNPHVDNPDTLSYVIEKGKKTDLNIYTCANVTMGMKGEELTDAKNLINAGAVGITDDGVPIMSEELCRKACEIAKELDIPISFHEEDKNLITENGVNFGKVANALGLTGSPRDAEITMVKRDIELNKSIGAKIDIQHISAKESVELVREAKARGEVIFAEATPHHFSLTEDAVLQFGTNAKMNPPLREEADRQAVIAGLMDGTIDMIATDHAPHAKEEKEQEFKKAPSGIIGLETALSLAVTVLVKENGMSFSKLVEIMSLNPSRLYKLNAGTLSVGAPADIVIFDPEAEVVYNNFKSRSQNSPFIGKVMNGKIMSTFVGGKKVYEVV